jgi:hypothetical protein
MRLGYNDKVDKSRFEIIPYIHTYLLTRRRTKEGHFPSGVPLLTCGFADDSGL